ncbi:hypothetical protein [Streptomyces sp. NPDC017941]|uniref:hypothetical protein n=1 Tax=Streptomyces sp. NPDC017941 TaxID=3365018 RepID=UPI0037ADF139
MRAADQSEYIVQCVREAASMYEDDARKFLAEHDSHVRAEALAEAGLLPKADVVAWLTKKAREQTPVELLPSKADRGAIRPDNLLMLADAVPAEPLVVSRFDTAIEPAPEEELVLTIGAIAEDGRPVALLLDVETRAKVAAWLTVPAPRPASSRERRLERLLDTIRTRGGQWTTQRLMDLRRLHEDAPCRSTARRDLAELARRGHLTQHGPANGRFYLLATRKDGRS